LFFFILGVVQQGNFVIFFRKNDENQLTKESSSFLVGSRPKTSFFFSLSQNKIEIKQFRFRGCVRFSLEKSLGNSWSHGLALMKCRGVLFISVIKLKIGHQFKKKNRWETNSKVEKNRFFSIKKK